MKSANPQDASVVQPPELEDQSSSAPARAPAAEGAAPSQPLEPQIWSAPFHLRYRLPLAVGGGLTLVWLYLSVSVIGGSVANLGETLVLRAEEVGGMSRQALDQVSAWTQVARNAESTAANAERVSEQARQIGEGLQRQTTDMREATREAQDVLRILNERRRQAGTQEFLRDATFVMERLQSLAIDMNRVLETEFSEDDWQRYSKGDKGLFVRKMLGMRERSRLAAVAQRYREDAEFREYVNRYIAQFENTLGEAKKRDMDGVLATTFLTADVGKVYMLLIRALGRET